MTQDVCIVPAVRKPLHLDPRRSWAGLLLDEAKQQRPSECARCLPRRAWPALSKRLPARRIIEATASGRNVAQSLPPRSVEGGLCNRVRGAARGWRKRAKQGAVLVVWHDRSPSMPTASCRSRRRLVYFGSP